MSPVPPHSPCAPWHRRWAGSFRSSALVIKVSHLIATGVFIEQGWLGGVWGGMGTPSLCTPAVAVGGGSSLCLQLLGAGSGRRWMWLHGRGGHLWRDEGWKAVVSGRREQLGTSREEGSPSPSLRPQAAPPSRV